MSRLFAAVLPPAEVVAHLDEHLDALRTARPELRWQHPVKWHVTLQFLGECGPYEVDRQLDRWERRARRGRPFDLRLAGAGTFPSAVVAKVLWAGIAGDLTAFQRVAAADQEPHLTLARTRDPIDLTGVVGELARYAGPSWRVGSLSLMQSHRVGASGTRYDAIEEFVLGGVADDGSD